MSDATTKEIVQRGFMNPATVKEGMELAAWIAKSDLAPRDYKDKPQNVLIAMQMGLEVGLSPMQAIQNIAVINGRPSIWGDAMLALVQNHKDFESIDENQSTAEKGVCIVKRRGMEPQRREFTVDDARKAGLWGKQGPWQTAPARMLKLRARAFALRDTFADALRGLQSAEEQRDVVETTTVEPTKTTTAPVEMPKRLTETPAAETQAAPAGPQAEPQKKITLPQAKRLFAIAKEAGRTDEEVKAHLLGLGIKSSLEVTADKYEEICRALGQKSEVEQETPGVGE